MTTTVIDSMPAVVTDQWTDLLIPQSMHALRVPSTRSADAPWRALLARHPVLALGRLRQAVTSTWGVGLVMSHLCNMSCVYCFSEAGRSRAVLPLDQMLAVVDYALGRRQGGDRKSFSVHFFGGEPTLHMREVRAVVEHVIHRCAAMGVDPVFRMVTNGTAARSDLDFLIDHGVQLVVSMDASPRRQRDQRIYGPHHNVAGTVATIRHLVARSTPFRVRSTVTGQTVTHLVETVRYFAELGVRFVHFEPVGPSANTTPGRKRRYHSPAPEQYAEQFELAMVAARECGVGLFSYAFQHLVATPDSYCNPMSGDDGYLVVNATGEIIMCPEQQDSERTLEFGRDLGRVTDEPRVSVDLHAKRANGDRARPGRHPGCQSCFAHGMCAGGCPSRNLQATGSPTTPDPYSCAIAKALGATILGRIAAETFAGAEPSDDVILRPIALPPELCVPSLVQAAAAILNRVRLGGMLTGEVPNQAVDAQLRRLTSLLGTTG